jgi:uncharacterized membrane protein YraQ (UPF0718 family)
MIVSVVKKNKLLTFVLLLYIVAAFLTPNKAIDSLYNSVYYIKEMALIMPIILIITTLIETWIPKKVITKNLGKQSGLKGILFSFVLGSISAGPIYAAFPICKMLFSKGASVYNIVIILSSWAVIKIPMLINEFKFLGLNFMITRWILTVIAILMIAYLVSKTVKPVDIKTSSKVKKTIIATQYCIKCGVCVKNYPNIFEINNNKVCINKDLDISKYKAELKDAADKCPVKAISDKL